MNKKFLLAIAVSITPWFLGCGGGGGDPAPVTPAVVTPPKPILIEAYGDSTMAGYAPHLVLVANTPPAVMQGDLIAQYGSKYVISVANDGVGGSVALNLVNGTDGRHLPWAQTLANSRANIMIFNFAINDANAAVGITHDQYRQALTTLVHTAKAAGKIAVLEEPNPICTDDAANLADLVNIMRDVANAEQVPLIPQYDAIKALPSWQAMLGDCIHPNQKLYTFKGHREASVIGPLLATVH